MDKLNELKALAELAQQLEEDGHFVEANTVHNRFIRVAQAKTHKVGPGESLSLIAKANGVSVNDLMKANDLTTSTLYPGDVLRIPSPSKDPGLMESLQKGIDNITELFTGKKETPKPMPPSKKPMAPAEKPITHRVSPGESLSLIAKKYGIPWQKIKEDNGLTSNTLQPGQPLIIKK